MKRYDHIGGSDAAAILGRNPYRTRLDVFREKVLREEYDLDGNKHIARGNFMEPLIEQYVRHNIDPSVNSLDAWGKFDSRFLEKDIPINLTPNFAMELFKDPKEQIYLRHPEYPYISGHPDGIGDVILWEFKAPASRTLQMIRDTGLKGDWYYQVQHYMLMTPGIDLAKIAVWDYDRWEPYILDVPRDERVQGIMLSRYQEFWESVLMSRDRPESEWMLPPADTVIQFEQTVTIDDPAFEEMLERYRNAYQMHYENKDIQAAEKGRILTYAQDRRTIITPRFHVNIAEVNNGRYKYTRVVVKEKDKVKENAEFPFNDDI